MFFDHPPEELKENEESKEGAINQEQDHSNVNALESVVIEQMPKITSLDIVSYAFLKEELVNTPEAAEVKIRYFKW